MRKFLLLFFAIFCFANQAYIDEFDAKFSTENQVEQLRIHHNLKNAYIKSIIDGDKSLKIEVLKRLVKSSKALGIEYGAYEKELIGLGVNEKTKQTKNKVENKIENEKKATIKQPLSVLNLTQKNQNLIVKFSRKIEQDELRIFDLNSKNMHRKVFDLDGILRLPSKTFKDFVSDEIRVAQYNKNIVRIVFSSEKELDLSYKIDGNLLVFSSNFTKNLVTEPKSPPKSRQNDKQKVADLPINKNKIIVIDAGHGGKDSGAINGLLYEKNVVLKIALKTGEILKERGYKIYYTRKNDKFIQLRDRTKFANEKMADLFLSIHANAAPNAQKAKEMQGVETFFLSPSRSERSKRAASLENKSDIDEMNYFTKLSFLNFLNREKIIASNKLAIDIQNEILSNLKKSYKVVDGGVREAPFWVLVGALMPAVLIEIGYITHPEESKKMSNDKYILSLSKGIANGVEAYFLKNQ